MNEQSIKEALSLGCPFCNYESESQIETTIRWYVQGAMKMRGQNGADEDMMYTICRKVTDTILRDYPSMTDKEFEIMLDAGVSGEFTKDTWVSGAMILQWLRLYNQHQTRLTVIDEKDKEERTINRKTKAEIDELNKEAIEGKVKTAIEFYRKYGTIFYLGDDMRVKNEDRELAFHIPHFAAIAYDWFREQNRIPNPDDNQISDANKYADDMIAKKGTRKEFVESVHEDWYKSRLLESHIKNSI